MKNGIINNCLFILSLLCWGCSDDGANGDDIGNHPDAAFLQKNLSVTSATGVASAVVQWSATEWEITFEPGNFVTEVSPFKGGNDKDLNQTTRIKITYNENSGLKSRSQTIHIANKRTGQVSDLTIEQPAGYNALSVSIDRNTKYQHVAGFGGMYNPKIWLGSNLITANEMAKMYGPGGLGYSILRLMVYPNENDWSADVEAATFAQQNGAIVFASPWDCTDALADKVIRASDNKEVKHLKHENYEAYAQHLIKYINFMKDRGVNLYAVSMQNEPDMTFTYWLPAEVVDFMKRYGAKIRETGVKLMAPEACGTQPEYTDPILNNADAFANTDILAGHFYQGFINHESSYAKNRHDYICGLYGKLKGKSFWMTEHLYNDGESETDPSKWEFQKWQYNLLHLGKEISMSMEGNCSAYIYWYLKRFYGMLGDNDPRSLVPVGEVAKNGYILSHFSKYATNMTRIKALSGNANVLATAYTNEAGNEVTLVMLNLSNDKINAKIPVAGVKDIAAVETTATTNMAKVETGKLDEEDGVYVLLSGNSIVSVRLKF